MSSLTRSLIALAAILAIATAQRRPLFLEPNCAERDNGQPGQRNISLGKETHPCPWDIDTKGVCENWTTNTVMWQCGYYVKACNPDPDGPPPFIARDFIECKDPFEHEVTTEITVHCCSYRQ